MKIKIVVAALILALSAGGTVFSIAAFGGLSDTNSNKSEAASEIVNISKSEMKLSKTEYTYGGNEKKPSVTVKCNGKTLTKGVDYTVSYQNNKRIGTASVKISGKNNYCGTKTVYFKINAVSMTKCSVSKTAYKYYKYNGEAVTPAIRVKYSGKRLVKNRDYTISYRNNLYKGTGTVVITGTGVYSGTVTRSFKIADIGWKTVGGQKYYVNHDGKYAKGFTKIGSHTYYFNKNGVMLTSWQKIKGSYYFFDRLNGKQAKNKSVDGIKLYKSGKAERTSYSVSKIDTMMYAHRIVRQVSKPTDSMATKRLKCFKWVFQYQYHRFRLIANMYHQKGWEITFANDIFKRKCGCCVSESAAVAFLFHECGYKTVYVCHDTGHAWVQLNGCIYDPLFAEARKFSDNYNIPLSNGYRSNPVQRRMI